MELHTVKEVAEILKVSKSLIYTLIAQNKLNCVRIGIGRGTIRISQSELDQFLTVSDSDQEQQSIVGNDFKFIVVNRTT